MTTTEPAPIACAFAKAVLARQGRCPLVVMALEGEAERPRCSSAVGRANCATLLALLRERGAFALRLAPGAPLTHATELRLQCGGLRGVAAALGGPDEPPADIHALVARAQATFGGLAEIPFAAVVPAMRRWEGRPRAGGGSGP